MLGGYHQQRLGATRHDLAALHLEFGVEFVAPRGILDQVGTPGHARTVTTYAGVDQAHACFPSAAKLAPPPVMV